MESVDIKILVKDTTLMNGTKEQGERYLFTLDHSRLLNEIDSWLLILFVLYYVHIWNVLMKSVLFILFILESSVGENEYK